MNVQDVWKSCASLMYRPWPKCYAVTRSAQTYNLASPGFSLLGIRRRLADLFTSCRPRCRCGGGYICAPPNKIWNTPDVGPFDLLAVFVKYCGFRTSGYRLRCRRVMLRNKRAGGWRRRSRKVDGQKVGKVRGMKGVRNIQIWLNLIDSLIANVIVTII